MEVYLFSQQSNPTLCLVLVYVLDFREDPKSNSFERACLDSSKGTTLLGLWYPKRTGIETIVYVKWNCIGNKLIRKAQVVLALLYLLTQ